MPKDHIADTYENFYKVSAQNFHYHLTWYHWLKTPYRLSTSHNPEFWCVIFSGITLFCTVTFFSCMLIKRVTMIPMPFQNFLYVSTRQPIANEWVAGHQAPWFCPLMQRLLQNGGLEVRDFCGKRMLCATWRGSTLGWKFSKTDMGGHIRKKRSSPWSSDGKGWGYF